MLIRIVRMYFKEESAEFFLQIFNEHKEQIRRFPGCTHLELLKNPDNPAGFATLSHWATPIDLENYRQSELFRSVWGRVKPLFSEPSQAFSLEKFIEL
jgi:heme-degrading monooxygenase HmoA